MITVCSNHCLKSFQTVKKEKCTVCKQQKTIKDYKKAYNILMDYFDCIPEDERQEVSDKLNEVGL